MTDTLIDVRGQFLTDAAQAMDAMASGAAATAACYRRNRLGEAHELLAALMGELRQFGMLVTSLRDTLGVDPGLLAQGGMTLDQQLSSLGKWLEQLIAAHRQEDWVSLADVLELDLEPLLRGWGLALLTCRSQNSEVRNCRPPAVCDL